MGTEWSRDAIDECERLAKHRDRLLDRAEKLRRDMIEAESWLNHGQPEEAKKVLARSLTADC